MCIRDRSGTVAETLNSPLAVHLKQLNMIRRAVPALQKGQYTKDSEYVTGNMLSLIHILDECYIFANT